ncbi:hypothetical protein, partial [Paenibacillus xylanexedens]|uniref:hypothetical protein n=1 Tax=Paenibacillus xylanexedens TaxID=528191 RepID=UPI001C92FA0F
IRERSEGEFMDVADGDVFVLGRGEDFEREMEKGKSDWGFGEGMDRRGGLERLLKNWGFD